MINNEFDIFGFSGCFEENADFIPLIADEEEENRPAELPEVLPVLPLKNTVVFPGVILPISVGRERSLKLVRDVYATKNRFVAAVAQKEPDKDDPAFDELYEVGTVAYILRMLEMPDGSTTIIIQGKKRIQLTGQVDSDPYFTAHIQQLPELKPANDKKEFDAVVGSLKDIALRIIRMSSNIPPEASFAIKNIESSTFLINFISSNSDIPLVDKQKLLEINELDKRARQLLEYMTRELQMLELKVDIQTKVKKELDKQQKEFLLTQQIKTIQTELGGNPVEKEIEELRMRAKEKKWTQQLQEAFEKDLSKLQRINSVTPEYSVQINYLNLLLELPWNEYTEDQYDLKRAEKILEANHFGLEKVKERILEHLAVLKLKKDMKSPILCFLGPPGVGKTSLGKSIAESLGRKYVRMSLGGLHDEAEIRGHRKTYIGSMPGRIMQSLKKVKSANPVFVLDEVDKMGQSLQGDPASALLEVLDPEQNMEFYDNYVEHEFDLSKVLFITTANSTNTIHPALLDRMEVIYINGYIVEEKVEIARRHLLPKQMREHGIGEKQLQIDNSIFEYIIDNYTRESGVRELDKLLAKVMRSVARKIASTGKAYGKIQKAHISKILGVPKYVKEKYDGEQLIGVVTGLAWTSSGGEILYVESAISKGKGKLTITGNLGDVMKESATIALAYLKANAHKLQLKSDVFERWDVHIHVPEGAIPKDGPSAGIAMVTALVSVFTQRKVKKAVAMTGEITLRGKLMPVGGIKEKILAAKRSGISEVILPAENRKDIEEIKAVYREGLKIHYASEILEVLNMVLLKKK